jgi:hypothetical protein
MFLPFGTLAPGLLLPLLAFAYMLLFGSYALNKTAEKIDAGKHEVRISEAPGMNSAAGYASYYLFSDDGPADQGLDRGNDNPVIRQVICWIINIPDKQYIQYFHLTSHFTRPPPSLIQA